MRIVLQALEVSNVYRLTAGRYRTIYLSRLPPSWNNLWTIASMQHDRQRSQPERRKFAAGQWKPLQDFADT